MGFLSRPPSIARRPAVAIASLLIIASGLFFVVRGVGQNNTIIQKFERPLKGGLASESGATVGYVTSSGALALSGRTLKVSDQNAGTGRILVNSTLGGLICLPNTSGTMKAVIIDNVTVTVRTPVGTECADN